MFGIVSMMRITGVEIAKKSKCAKQTANRKVLKHCKSYIHCVRHVRNDDLNYVWHSMMRITGVEISKMSKCAKQTANRKVLKHCKSYIHCVRHVGNDDLNYVCHS